MKLDVWGCRVPRIRHRANSKTDFTEQRVWNLIEALGGYPEQRSPRYWLENSRIVPSMRTCGATARRFRSSKTPQQSQSELSAHQMPMRRSLGLQNFVGRLIPSELSSHQMAIHSHPGVSRIQLILLHFSIFGPTERFNSGSTQTLRVPVPSGVFPHQARASTSAYLHFDL